MDRERELDNHRYPFDGGTVVPDSPYYVKRDADRELLQGLKNGLFCYVFNSRQTGKSSLRTKVKSELSQESNRFVCIGLDLSGLGQDYTNFGDWCEALIEQVIDQLNAHFKKSSLILWLKWYRVIHLPTSHAKEADLWLISFIYYLVSKESEPNLRLRQEQADSNPPIVQLNNFFEQISISYPELSFVFLIDEIDSVLGLPFKTDDFFIFIRYCYNQRAEKNHFKRISFALFGVATPSQLIQNRNGTPFNIGKAIKLQGFRLKEAQPLTRGFGDKVDDPQKVLEAILDWTNGQPFLTQKLCNFVLDDSLNKIERGNELQAIEELVQTRVIENWAEQDEPEHLNEIRNRILQKDDELSPEDEKRIYRILKLYREILQKKSVPVDNSLEQDELLLSGLIVEKQRKLKVSNRIYEKIFDTVWIEETIADLRPYREALEAWLLSEQQDKSRLLTGAALEEALAWAEKHNNLSEEERAFLDDSEALEGEIKAEKEATKQAEQGKRQAEEEKEQAEQAKRQAEQRTELAEQAKRQAEEAKKQAEQGIEQAQREKVQARLIAAIAVLIALATIFIAPIATRFWYQNQAKKFAEEAASSFQLKALLLAAKSGEALKSSVEDESQIKNYALIQPLTILQASLIKLQQKNQIEGIQQSVKSVKFSPDFLGVASSSTDGYIAAGFNDGKILLWREDSKIPWQAHTKEITGLSVSQDRQFLVTVGADSTVRIWDVPEILSGDQSQSPQPKEEFSFDGSGRSISFNVSGEHIAVGAGGGKVYLWSQENQRWRRKPAVLSIHGDTAKVRSVAFHPTQNNLLATGGGDGAVYVSDISKWQSKPDSAAAEKYSKSKGSAQPIFQFPQGEPVTSVSFSEDGQWLVAASSKGTIELAKFTQGQWVKQSLKLDPAVENLDTIHHIVFNSSAQLVAVARGAGAVRLLKLTEGKDGLSLNKFQNLDGHQGEVWDLSFSQNGNQLVTGGNDGTVRIWDLSKLQPLNQEESNRIMQIAVGFKGKAVIDVRKDGQARLWSAPLDESWQETEEPTRRLDKQCEDKISYVSMSQSDEKIALVKRTGGVCLIKDYTGDELPDDGDRGTEHDLSTMPVKTADFGPGDLQITTVGTKTVGTKDEVTFWDVDSQNVDGSPLPENEKVEKVIFSSDKQQVMILGNGMARLQDRGRKEWLSKRIKESLGGVNSAGFSQNGKYVGMAGKNGGVFLWLLSEKTI